MTSVPWTDVPLVALDLEGSGAQDRDNEAILEIALVPIAGGRPSLHDAYTTLINPQRTIPRRPWIAPGLTNTALATAPPMSEVEPRLAARLDARVIVGHNVGVDWRLLHRRCPTIKPAGLIDTLRLTRHLYPAVKGKGLAALLERHDLTAEVNELAPDSQPHRAAWDAAAAAALLTALIADLPNTTVSIEELKRLAGLLLGDDEDDQEQLPILDTYKTER